MNRILLESSEVVEDRAVLTGERARHVLDVLHGEVGQVIKTGEVNGKIGQSEIVKISNAEPGKEELHLRVTHDKEGLKPWCDLILAPPRPRAMKRLLPQLASLGVGRIVLVGAKKVEKDFWGATLLKEENYRPLFITGLMQSGTSILPTLSFRRNFRKFLTEEIDEVFPFGRRIVAHPYGANDNLSADAKERLLLAVGPEGGWTEEEVELLECKGFMRYSLGERILRTDTALIALLSRFM